MSDLDILIPVYEPGNQIIELLASLLACCRHSLLKLTIHISDDCSPHFSWRDLQSLPSSARFALHYHRNQANLRECANVNAAVRRFAAEGREWFLLLHHDDFVSADCLPACAAYISGWRPGMP